MTEMNRQTAGTGFAVPENDAARTPTTGTRANHKRSGSHSTTDGSIAPDFVTRRDDVAGGAQ